MGKRVTLAERLSDGRLTAKSLWVIMCLKVHLNTLSVKKK